MEPNATNGSQSRSVSLSRLPVQPVSGALAIRPPSTLAEIRELGTLLAQSGYFQNTSDMAKAVAKIMAGAEMGFGPIAALSGIHIVEGKPVISAGLMATAFKKSDKYSYVVVKLDNDGCILDIYERGKKVGQSSFVKQDAIAAELMSKANWKRYPRNMYFARAISNAVKFFAGDVFDGTVYTLDEMDMEEDGSAEIVDVRVTGTAAREAVVTQDVAEAPLRERPESVVGDATGEKVGEIGDGRTFVSGVSGPSLEELDAKAELDMIEAFSKGSPREYWEALSELAERMDVHHVQPPMDANENLLDRYSAKLLKRIWERMEQGAAVSA